MGHCGNVAAVIARSEATKQSSGTGLNLSELSPDPLDCFAALAMTISGAEYPALYKARVIPDAAEQRSGIHHRAQRFTMDPGSSPG